MWWLGGEINGGVALGSFSSFYIASMLYTWFFHGKETPTQWESLMIPNYIELIYHHCVL